MKNAFVFSLLLGISFSVYAGPFGLEKGMTLEQITDVCGSVPKHISDDRYLVSPIKKLIYGLPCKFVKTLIVVAPVSCLNSDTSIVWMKFRFAMMFDF